MRIAKLVTSFWVLFAVGWAVFVLGAFFVLRFLVPPFSHWSHGDQAQLFQGMVGIAGFGAGVLAVGAAMFQIRRITAEPVLKVSVVGSGFGTGGGWVGLQVLNTGSAVCRDWQVAVTATPDLLDRYREDDPWVRIADRSLVYNASGKPLFPGSALGLPSMLVNFYAFDNRDSLESIEIRCFMTTEFGRTGPDILTLKLHDD